MSDTKKEPTNYSVDTQCVHTYPVRGPLDPVALPIYPSSTYRLSSANHGAKLCSREPLAENESQWLYSRWGNPTNDSVARVITDIEKGHGTLLFSSGMAAISSSLFSFLRAGDHVVSSQRVYGGTHEIFSSILPSYGVEVTMLETNSIAGYEQAIKKNTKVLYGETPSNPNLSITDLAGLAKLGMDKGIVTMIDGTFGSSYNQQAIALGIDVSIHSATKYLAGHSDVLGGCVTTKNKSQYEKIFQTQKLFGGCMSPFDAFLLGRGLKTFAMRVEKHNSNALAIAKFLEKNEKVAQVFYPGLPSHPDHVLAKKQMTRGFGGVVAFEVKGGVAAGKQLIEQVKLITLAVSLGGVESLIEHAASMTHTMVPRDARIKAGVTDGLIRFSVGCENPDDLIKDLEQALASITLE